MERFELTAPVKDFFDFWQIKDTSSDEVIATIRKDVPHAGMIARSIHRNMNVNYQSGMLSSASLQTKGCDQVSGRNWVHSR